MNHDTIKVEVDYNLEDIQSFQRSYLYSRISRVQLVVLGLFFIGCAVVSFIWEYSNGGIPFSAIFFFIISIFLLIVFPSVLKKSAKSTFETNKLIRNTHSFQINNEAIKVFSSTSESNLSWDILYKAVETKESFLLYISKVQAFIIPKRCFADHEDQIALLRGYITNAPVPKDDKKKMFTPKRIGIGFLAYALLFFVILIVLLIYGK